MAEVVPLYGDTSSDAEEQQKYHRKWMDEITRAEKYFGEWERKGEDLVRLYRKQGQMEKARRKFAMLWSNTEVMKPTLYARPPEPSIGRRFKDQDPAGRTASDILERCASYIFEKANIDSVLRNARDDLLLPGRGTLFVRFVTDGQIAVDYIHWRDFLHKPARRWEEVSWVAKRVYMDKTAFQQRWPTADLKGKSPDNVPKSAGISDEEKKTLEGKWTVWEIWDKSKGVVCWIAPTMDRPLQISQAPDVTLEGFWPCPKPLYATMTTDSLIPVPDYSYYRDQAEEIDDLTRRIANLTDKLKVVGFYPRGAEASTEIEKALLPSVEDRMIGVESWAAFADKGGSNAIVYLPIEQIVKTIQACVELRRQLIEDVYQITGLSDIMRGATDPNETATAQQLKAQTGSIRVRDRQQEIQRFARDTLGIICEIIAEKFSPQTLLQMSNLATKDNFTPEKVQEFTGAITILKSDQSRGFRIDIETDSTVALNEDAEKQRRVEFATAMGGLLKEAVPLAAQVPELVPLIGATLQFVVRGFKAGRELEDIIDKTMKQLEAKAQSMQNQPPEDPKVTLDKQRLEEVDKPKAESEAALNQAKAAQITGQHEIERQRLGMEQDQMWLGEGARQEERQDALASEAADREQAATERQDDLAKTAGEREDNQMAMALKAPQAGAGGHPPPEGSPPPQGQPSAPAAFLQALAANQQQGSAAAQQLAQVAAAPSQLETPGGIYTARKVGELPQAAPAPAVRPMAGGPLAQMVQALLASQQQNTLAMQQLVQILAMPTVVETPRGRYVSRKVGS